MQYPGSEFCRHIQSYLQPKDRQLSADPEDASLIDSHLEGSFRDTVPEDVNEKRHPNTNGLGKTTIISPWAP